MAATIGIKIANGEFYSIVEENSPAKKRLILTTVHDRQTSVQIDLYKSGTKTMADAMYIGSLVVENITPRQKGEPSIELIIKSAQDGTISANAMDMDPAARKEQQYLNVSLKSLNDDYRDYEIPDFELEAERPPSGLYGKAEALNQDKKKNRVLPLVLVLILVFLVLCFSLWFFFRGSDLGNRFRDALSGQETSQVQNTAPAVTVSAREPAAPQLLPPEIPEPQSFAQTEVSAAVPALPEAEPESTAAIIAPPVIEAPAIAPEPAEVERSRPVPPVRSYRVPAAIPRAGAAYRIRWGDTLWDIAEAFYRNPWLYPRIARFNNIRNPDWIISGTTIRIPPRN